MCNEDASALLRWLYSFAIGAGDKLEAFGDDIRASLLCKEMDMVGDDDLSEYAETEAFLGFEYPAQVTATITANLREIFSDGVVICHSQAKKSRLARGIVFP